MVMRGQEIYSIEQLMKQFCIDELLYVFCSGELSIWLAKIGETEKSAAVKKIPHNAKALSALYGIFDLQPDWTDEEICALFCGGIKKRSHNSDKVGFVD